MFFILGSNLRFDAPSLNIKVRKVLRNNPAIKVFSAGSTASLFATYPVVNLGDIDLFWRFFFKGKHKLSKSFYKSKAPCIVVNSSLRGISDSIQTLVNSSSIFNKIQGEWLGLNFLSLDASSNLLQDLSLGFLNNCSYNLNKRFSFTSLYNFGNDNLVFESGGYDFVTYQGYHGDTGASNANLVIPTLHPYESSVSSYLNIYGDFQFISKVRTFSPLILSNSDILGYISERLGIIKVLNPFWFRSQHFTIAGYSFRTSFINFRAVGQGFLDSYSWLLRNPLNSLDVYAYRFGSSLRKFSVTAGYPSFISSSYFALDQRPLNPRYFSFYLSDSSTRASHIMALSQSRFKQSTSFYN